jgi:hypothetical protein
VFVPLHRRRQGAIPGARTRPARTTAVIVAVLSALAAGLVASLLDGSRRHDSGDYVVLGLLVAAVAVAVGFGIAKAVGRQGKV